MTDEERQRVRRIEKSMRTVRIGHGANCSSVGSVIDTLFASAIVGGAIFAAIAAAMATEKVTEVKASRPPAKAKDGDA